MDMRADIAAMLRARWWLLAVWAVVVAAITITVMRTEWWDGPTSAFTPSPVVRSGQAERELRRIVDERLAAGVVRDPAAPVLDLEQAPELDEQVAKADTTCADALPFRRPFEGYVGPIAITVHAARLGPVVDDGYATERAPSGTTYLEVTLEAKNDADEAQFPMSYVAVVDRQARFFRYTYEAWGVDRIGELGPGQRAAGVLVFKLTEDDAEALNSLYVVLGGDLWAASEAATAMGEGACVQVTPTKVEQVGDSPRVEDARLVQ